MPEVGAVKNLDLASASREVDMIDSHIGRMGFLQMLILGSSRDQIVDQTASLTILMPMP